MRVQRDSQVPPILWRVRNVVAGLYASCVTRYGTCRSPCSNCTSLCEDLIFLCTTVLLWVRRPPSFILSLLCGYEVGVLWRKVYENFFFFLFLFRMFFFKEEHWVEILNFFYIKDESLQQLFFLLYSKKKLNCKTSGTRFFPDKDLMSLI